MARSALSAPHLQDEAAAFAALRAAESTGRPRGTRDFVADLELRLDRPVAKRKPGRKPRDRLPSEQGLPDEQVLF